MSSWRVEQHYGFGAARIPIQPEPHASLRFGLLAGVGYLVSEIFAGGPAATVRRLIGQTPAMALGLLLMIAFVVTLSQDRSDQSPIEVVLFTTSETVPDLIPEVVPPEPIPMAEPIPKPKPIEIARPDPPKVDKPPKARPQPPPPVIARAQPKPKARPRPVIPQIARVETPKVQPLARVERADRDRPELANRPKVRINSTQRVQAPAALAPRIDRVARANVDRTASPHPKPQLMSPAVATPTLAASEPRQRAFRVASAKPTPGVRPKAVPGLAPAPKIRDVAPTTTNQNTRLAPASRSTPTARSARPAPSLDRAPVPQVPALVHAQRERAARPAPRPVTERAARPVATMARATSAASLAAANRQPASAGRVGRAAPTVTRGDSDDHVALAGVPLGDLAACLTDREEDRLKQAVVAAVTTQEECVSSKGTYRFIETKNLNAFLMWIDRASTRAVSDRCVELGYALECLGSASQRAAR